MDHREASQWRPNQPGPPTVIGSASPADLSPAVVLHPRPTEPLARSGGGLLAESNPPHGRCDISLKPRSYAYAQKEILTERPSVDTYFALAEGLDVPVAIHMGTGGSGRANLTMPKFRRSMGNQLLL